MSIQFQADNALKTKAKWFSVDYCMKGNPRLLLYCREISRAEAH